MDSVYRENQHMNEPERTIKKPFWLSIRRANRCLYSRRTGSFGKRIFGFSVCLRLFGIDII